MRIGQDSIKGLLIPTILVATATLLTVPWSYFVVKAAFDRDMLDVAKNHALRVELGVARSNAGPLTAQQILETEMQVDRAVQVGAYYDLQYGDTFVGWKRESWDSSPKLKMDEIVRRANGDVLLLKLPNSYQISVPLIFAGKGKGFTYIEFSRQVLSEQFWEKEGALVRRVIGTSATVIFILSVVAIYAYGTRMKVSNIRQRAEMTEQGLIAERSLTAAVLAHEIRNPLAALRFLLHSLRKNSDNAQKVAQSADTIDSELLRIHQLVTDYLEHEKARSFRVQNVNLLDAAAGLQMVMSEMFRQTNTELFTIPAGQDVIVSCDPHALRQVLMNLVLNAQQAMGTNGRITLKIGVDGSFGTLDVKDNGPGIPPEIREQLFKPFVTGKTDGHGIGLALVKRFVDNFGGSVQVESESGMGTTFHLKLPLAASGISQLQVEKSEN